MLARIDNHKFYMRYKNIFQSVAVENWLSHSTRCCEHYYCVSVLGIVLLNSLACPEVQLAVL